MLANARSFVIVAFMFGWVGLISAMPALGAMPVPQTFEIGPGDPAWAFSAQGHATFTQADDGLRIRLEALQLRDNRTSGAPLTVTHLRLALSDLTGAAASEANRTTLLVSRPFPLDRTLQAGEVVQIGPLPQSWMPRPNWKQIAPRYELEIIGRDESGQEMIVPVPTTLQRLNIASAIGTDWHPVPETKDSWDQGGAIAVAGPVLLIAVVWRAKRRWPIWALLTLGWFIGGWPLLMSAPTITWESVPATVLDSDVAMLGYFQGSGRAASPVHTVTVSYMYRVGDATFVSNQWQPSGSPLLNAQAAQREHERLATLRTTAEPIHVWVDPQQPQHAVLQRWPGLVATLVGGVFWLCVFALLVRRKVS